MIAACRTVFTRLARKRILWIAFVLAAVAIVLAGAFAQSHPYRTPEPLPAAKILDMHCHTAGIGAGNSGCFLSPELQESHKFRFYLHGFGCSRREIEQRGDAIILQRISAEIEASKHVGAAIILALDGVVDKQGNLDRERTELYVPNEFVATETARYANLHWGASINPKRHDAMARLAWAKEHGAKLVKWIPSIMLFDPADPSLTPFYSKLIEYRLPLLTHAGRERSFTHAQDQLCDPQRLHLPLSMGVIVIVAHIASTGVNAGERDTDRLARMMDQYPNLYSEISSLTQINKLGYLREAVQRREWRGRLLYGSDFPLIDSLLVSPFYFPWKLTPLQMFRIQSIDNPWDRDVKLKQALGVPQDVFARSAQLFPSR